MADLVDRWPTHYGLTHDGLSPVVRFAPMDEIDELRAEIKMLKLHLDLVHDCKGPKND